MTGHLDNFLQIFEHNFEANINPQSEDIQQSYADSLKTFFDTLDPSQYQDAYLDLEEVLKPDAIAAADDGRLAELREAFQEDATQLTHILYAYWAMKNGCIPQETLKIAYTTEEITAISQESSDANQALLDVKAARERGDTLAMTSPLAIQERIKQLKDSDYINKQVADYGNYVPASLVRAKLASELEFLETLGNTTGNGTYYANAGVNTVISTFMFPVAGASIAPFLLVPAYVVGLLAQGVQHLVQVDPGVSGLADPQAKKYADMASALASVPQLATSAALNKGSALFVHAYNAGEHLAVNTVLSLSGPGPHGQTGSTPPAGESGPDTDMPTTTATSTRQRRSASPTH